MEYLIFVIVIVLIVVALLSWSKVQKLNQTEKKLEQTRKALDASPTAALRNLDPTRMPPAPPGPVTVITDHWRLLVGLFLLFACLFGFWLRERARAVSFT